MLKSNKVFIYILFIVMVFLFAGLGSFPLTDRDEGEYASCALNMLRSHDYILPTLNGRPYLEKPILFFWILSGSIRLFGANEFALRLPSAISGVFLISLLFSFIKFTTKKKELAAISSLILLSSPLFLVHFRACITDPLLCLFIESALFSFFLFMEEQKGKEAFWLIGSFSLSLAFLTKGPIALAMVCPIMLFYGFLKKDWDFLGPKWLLIAIGSFLIINLPWFYLIFKRTGKEFFDTFFVTQNLKRFTTAFLGHGGGPLFYLLLILVGFFPFSGLLPLSFKVKDNEKNGIFKFSLLSSLWILTILTITATKQINYILPISPFLSIVMAYIFFSLWKEGKRPAWPKSVKITVTLGAFVLFTVFLLALFSSHFWEKLLLMTKFKATGFALPDYPIKITRWAILFMILILFITSKFFYSKERMMVIAGTLTFSFIVSVLFLPSLSNTIEAPSKSLSLKIKKIALTHPEAKVHAAFIGLWKPSMIFYTGMNFERYKIKRVFLLEKRLQSKEPVFVFSKRQLLKFLKKKCPHFYPIELKGGYLLGGNIAAKNLFNLKPL